MSQNQAAADLALVDDHLRMWDQFAQGSSELAPVLNANRFLVLIGHTRR